MESIVVNNNFSGSSNYINNMHINSSESSMLFHNIVQVWKNEKFSKELLAYKGSIIDETIIKIEKKVYIRNN